MTSQLAKIFYSTTHSCNCNWSNRPVTSCWNNYSFLHPTSVSGWSFLKLDILFWYFCCIFCNCIMQLHCMMVMMSCIWSFTRWQLHTVYHHHIRSMSMAPYHNMRHETSLLAQVGQRLPNSNESRQPTFFKIYSFNNNNKNLLSIHTLYNFTNSQRCKPCHLYELSQRPSLDTTSSKRLTKSLLSLIMTLYQ